jgi:hypothetical protein
VAARDYELIQRNPKYRELVHQRSALGWTLSAITLIIYFGFILLIAYAPKFRGTPIGTERDGGRCHVVERRTRKPDLALIFKRLRRLRATCSAPPRERSGAFLPR